MIEILNRHHFKGKLPKDARPIHRPSPLGNPWTHIPSKLPVHMRYAIYVPTREESIARYRPWLLNLIFSDKPNKVKEAFEALLKEYEKTGSLKLLCYCREKPGNKVVPCHGDVIAAAITEITNQRKNQVEAL